MTIPLFLAILLLYHFDKPLTAASWSVLAREIQKSIWPSILRSDTVGSRNVHWTVRTVANISLALSILIFITGIVTPLGLSDEVVLSKAKIEQFVYTKDLTSFGLSTSMQRSDLPNRNCRYLGCNTNDILAGDSPRANTTVIEPEVLEFFESGTKNSTVASIWDIQYRLTTMRQDDRIDGGKPYPAGIAAHTKSLLAEDRILLVEGGIVDMHNGGVGFRNHTAPALSGQGMEWQEDILWMSPEISCTPRNLSLLLHIDAERPDSNFSAANEYNITFVDEGGFANIRKGLPITDWPALDGDNPDIRLQADYSAWYLNIITGVGLNLTTTKNAKYGINATIGKEYKIRGNKFQNKLPVQLSTEDLAYPDFVGFMPAEFGMNGSLVYLNETYDPAKNTEQLASALSLEVNSYCRGVYNSADKDTHIRRLLCFQFFGMPKRIDGVSDLIQASPSKWKIPIHVCASGIKASVKQVSFQANGTEGLQDLTVLDIQDKKYDAANPPPTWAVEDYLSKNFTAQLYYRTTAPLWGIVDAKKKGTPGYNFTEAPDFFLPPALVSKSQWDDGPWDVLAGTTAPMSALRFLSTTMMTFTGDFNSIPSFGGVTELGQLALFHKIYDQDAGPAKILKLEWTNLMANWVVGTKTGKKQVEQPSGDDERLASFLQHRIKYDMRFAIPAIILLACWVLIILGSIAAGVVHRHLFTHLKKMLNDTSVGRAALRNHPDVGHASLARASTKKWAKEVGGTIITLGEKDGSYASLQEVETSYKNGQVTTVSGM